MVQYINKADVVAEILKRRERNKKNKLNIAAAFEDNYLLSFLDTLEEKEVDLEEEVANWWDEHYAHIKKGYTFEGYTGHYMENSTVISLAKHFYELGLKVRKGK